MYTTNTVMVSRPDGDLPVHRWIPKSPRGAVVVVQEIFGVSSYIRDRAADLADAGYIVDVPELYFRLENPVVADDDPELLAKGMELMSNTPWEQAVNDLRAATRNLAEEVNGDHRLGLVGFCYGGGVAYAATAAGEAEGNSPVSALVSYYGSALPTLLDLSVSAPSLHHFGTSDSFIPMDEVEKIQAHVVSGGAEFHLYEGADHAFDNTLPAFFHEQAAGLAWERTVAFLEEHIQD